MEKYFFDLPVYRLSRSKYYKWREETKIRPHEENWLSVAGRPIPQETKSALDQHIYEKYGPWEFNEIIGYIRLYFLGSQIRGDYLSAEKKRNPISRRKVFTFRTLKLAPEHQIWPEDQNSNQDIWREIQKYIASCEKQLTKGRVIDSSKLELLGPHIDWLSILGWKKKDE
ncbi:MULTISPECIES: hypothetical protein [Leisingera]|jgi:hypothetical protein|uniref:hypothetical protein n=1 Tax=Leisingera TaxID=191028 RepID=UPI00114FD3AE|nr:MULTISPECIES: hypothetical protein [Leisingera]QDI75902.1 hypothetical protein R2C4_09155 [Leisingera aquaemixtae]